MTTFFQTSHRHAGCGDLLAYIERDARDDLRNHRGEPLTDQERAAMLAHSERHEFTRDFIISPENGDRLSDRELSLRTRQTMREFLADRPNTVYAYGIHRDTEHPHVHVAIAGSQNSLYMDLNDIRETRARADEHFVERGREHTLRRDVARHRPERTTRAPEQQQHQQAVTHDMNTSDPDRGADALDAALLRAERQQQQAEQTTEYTREQGRESEHDRGRGI
ncbi:relaxase/mobilization nuclease domain-containing protein [Halomarina pelagica]|uniref:relaxase/mobilization nuclease domain-containing protein n=1 Tax=Halomarina pelagica TaxID=2961599 RepID=UPI0020C4F442|nr:relaxase [Halomarina sp. BND7]